MSNTQFEKASITHRKLQMRGEPYTKDSWEAPNLVFDIWAGNPRITVWSKHPAEKDKVDPVTSRPLHNTPIPAHTSITKMRSILEELKLMVGVHEPKVRTVKCFTLEKDAQGKNIPGKKITQSKIVYGRNPEGYLFIEVRQKGRPVLPFLFKEDDWHKREAEDEPSESKAYESDHVARGHLAMLVDIYSACFHDSWDPNWRPSQPAPLEETKTEIAKSGDW